MAVQGDRKAWPSYHLSSQGEVISWATYRVRRAVADRGRRKSATFFEHFGDYPISFYMTRLLSYYLSMYRFMLDFMKLRFKKPFAFCITAKSNGIQRARELASRHAKLTAVAIESLFAIFLAYLHEGLEPKVVHRDVKSSNILLDRQWNAKVNLVDWLKGLVGERKSEQVVDPKLHEMPSSKELKRILLVALKCVDHDATKRPKMGHVIHMLEASLTFSVFSFLRFISWFLHALDLICSHSCSLFPIVKHSAQLNPGQKILKIEYLHAVIRCQMICLKLRAVRWVE
ncbi:hypothetical protein Syun_020722 [Stephania yunnanensis]|uniref:Protein kinase domain-containing protein n=1 Tax=Stephania yunnanensis TaxID=152371 RepID=A0AAP0IEZ9_9MAGN